MNTIQIKILLALTLLISLISCKAQILPLGTSLADIPNNAYVKDTNNELSPFIGIYKANFNGNEITLFITKEENKLEERTNKNFYRDALVIKYVIKNSAGITLQDTKNLNTPSIYLYSISTRPAQNIVNFIYSGTNCRVGWGRIILKRISPTQISWEYRPNDRIIMPGKCPGNPDTTIYLPETKDLIFTKQ